MRARQEGPTVPFVFTPRAEQNETHSPEHLSLDHLGALTRAISNVLLTEIAEFTFAQILDGLPTLSSLREFHSLLDLDDHPVKQHTTLCDGVLERLRAFRSEFDPLSLKFDPYTLQAFQDATPGSQEFHLRLIELVAVACHQIAAFLSKLDNGHKMQYEGWLTEQQKLKDAGDEKYRFWGIPPTTPFYHQSYLSYYQYPRDVADVVGYWAEAKIFGGVVLFNRGDSDKDCKEVYFHGSLYYGPKTIYPPTPDQYQSLIAFLVSNSNSVSCPLPILATKDNRPRYDPYHAMKYFHIFRNRYERRLPEKFMRPEKYNWRDYPEITDNIWLMNHEFEVRQYGKPYDEATAAAVKERLKKITPSSPLWGDDPAYE